MNKAELLKMERALFLEKSKAALLKTNVAKTQQITNRFHSFDDEKVVSIIFETNGTDWDKTCVANLYNISDNTFTASIKRKYLNEFAKQNGIKKIEIAKKFTFVNKFTFINNTKYLFLLFFFEIFLKMNNL